MATRLEAVLMEVKAWVEVANGQPYLDNDTEIINLINRRLRAFSKETLGLYVQSAAFAVQSGVAAYNLEGTTNPVVSGGTTEFAKITSVTVNSVQLRDYNAMPNGIGIADLDMYQITRNTDPSGVPTLYACTPPYTLTLYPTPASAYSNSYVSGFRLHSTLTQINDFMEIPDDQIELFAEYVAVNLSGPFASGEGTPRRMQMKAEVDAEIKRLKAKNQRLAHPPQQRRNRTEQRICL